MNSTFLMALGRHDGGALVENCDALLRQVVREVTQHGGKGVVTLTAEVKPNGDTGLEVTFTVKATQPRRTQGRAFYYPTGDGDLSRTPPADEADQLLRGIPGGLAKA